MKRATAEEVNTRSTEVNKGGGHEVSRGGSGAGHEVSKGGEHKDSGGGGHQVYERSC